jgi:hypothetical protein
MLTNPAISGLFLQYFWGNVVSMGANVVHAGVQFFNSTEENSTHTHLALLLGGLFFIAEAVPKVRCNRRSQLNP